MAADFQTLIVSGFRAEARDVVLVELRDPTGAALPTFEPGAHLEITLPLAAGESKPLIRHYSICSDPADCTRYVVAVGRAADSRGGSAMMHEQIRVGAMLSVKGPRNNFPLAPDAARYRFVAGGIGITPIMAMIHWCEAQGTPWTLLYLCRSRQRSAFYEDLRGYGDRVTLHFDEEVQGPYADLAEALSGPQVDEHLYCCGPGALMHAVEDGAAGWPQGTVHFEWFGGAAPIAPDAPSEGFEVVLRKSGITIQVGEDQSILEAVEANGIDAPFVCREGMCRTCEVAICAGEADHRDIVLSDEERAAQQVMMICVSRSKTRVLELDL